MLTENESDSDLKIQVQTRKVTVTEYYVRCPKCGEEFKAFTEPRAKYLYTAHIEEKHGAKKKT